MKTKSKVTFTKMDDKRVRGALIIFQSVSGHQTMDSMLILRVIFPGQIKIYHFLPNEFMAIPPAYTALVIVSLVFIYQNYVST
jgi:hypothetical protein